jgi:TPR repeat protein
MIVYGILALVGGFILVINFAPDDSKKEDGGFLDGLGALGMFAGVVMLAIGVLAYPYNWIFGGEETVADKEDNSAVPKVVGGSSGSEPDWDDMAEQVKPPVGQKPVDTLEQKAEGGDAESQYKLFKQLFANDRELGLRWLNRAGDQGHVEALFELGNVNYLGKAGDTDLARAMKYYRKAAEKGHADSQYNLGVGCFKGQGVQQDDKEAFRWFQKAADQGHSGAIGALSQCYLLGIGVEKNERRAVELMAKAAEGGDGASQFFYADILEKGELVPKDLVKAMEWYRKAADGGHAESQHRLGSICYHQLKDFVKARQWFFKAAKKGHAKASGYLGMIYDQGQGVLEDDREAVKWYQRGAKDGDVRSQQFLGTMYMKGKGGLPRNERMAVELYRKAALGGASFAQYLLGVWYVNPGGVPRDLVEGHAWLKIASRTSDIQEAQELFARVDASLPEDLKTKALIRWVQLFKQNAENVLGKKP